MTLEEYGKYELAMSTMKNEIQVPNHGFTSYFFQSQHTPNPYLDKKDSSLEEILDDLFRIEAENLRKPKHKVPHRCNDKTVDITDYEDSDHEDGELHDLPIFSATNEFASFYEHVVENTDISIAKEKQKVLIEDTEMDENHDIDHSGSGSKGTKFEVTSARVM
nr:hypothetical protein [Tanacetum cinerariifolium]